MQGFHPEKCAWLYQAVSPKQLATVLQEQARSQGGELVVRLRPGDDETHAWWYSSSVSDKQTLLRVLLYGYAYSQWRISLLTCCRYVATPGLASSARTIVRCLKPNGLGTRPRSSLPLRVRTYYVRERKLSKEESHSGPGTCNPRTSGTCSAKREGATRAHPEK